MEEVIIDIIGYNDKMEKFGRRSFYLGLAIVMTNVFPFVWKTFGMVIVFIAMSFMILRACLSFIKKLFYGRSSISI